MIPWKKNKWFALLWLSALCVCLSLPITQTGCRTKLAADGAYQGDKTLYAADRTIVEAYDVLHSFVKFEFQNRAALANNPEIKKAADTVRQNAQTWVTSAINLRDAYAAAPTPENQKALQQALGVLRQAIVEAAKYVQAGLPK
jgi:hypothetical protein